MEQDESTVTIRYNTREMADDLDKSSICGIVELEDEVALGVD